MPELTFYCWIVSGKGATHSSSQNHHLFIYFVFLYRLELFFIHYFDILKFKTYGNSGSIDGSSC